jgi:hypothetical protein
MARDTLIEIVQFVLAEADGDEVNSISDTIESDQVARVIEHQFNIIVTEFDIKYVDRFQQLSGQADVNKPTSLTIPEGVYNIEELWYNRTDTAADPRVESLTFMDPVTFFKHCSGRTKSDSNVEGVTWDGVNEILIRNDVMPKYWTTVNGFDEVILDSFDNTIDTTVQTSKNMVRCSIVPTLALADATVPDLPEHLGVLLKNRARVAYWDVYKDGATSNQIRQERRSESRSQRQRYITKNLQQERSGPYYGRK